MIQSAEEFVLLRTSQRPEEYLRAANESAETPIWLEIIDRFPEMQFWVAQNKTVPLEILEVLAQSQDSSVRVMVAPKNRLSHALINALARDSDSAVRQRIAYNKETSRETLDILARDREALVSEVASNRLAR
jgi:hypothetical protein